MTYTTEQLSPETGWSYDPDQGTWVSPKGVGTAPSAVGPHTHAASDVAGSGTSSAAGWDVGDLKLTARSTAPAGWLLCDGSAVSRSTYANLFAALGTTYGAGDGLTTFNVPDYRGRSPMGAGTGTGGGASGTGLPTGGSALTARALGAWTGEESHALSTAELASHGHSHNHGSHTHSHNHGSHSHSHSHGAATTGTTSGNHTHTWGGVDGCAMVEGSGTDVPGTNRYRAAVGTPQGATFSTDGQSADHTHSFTPNTDATGATPSTDATATTPTTDATTAGSGTAHNTMHPSMTCNVLIKT